MTNIELYIDSQLCDIISPVNLGIRLNRIFLNPAELNTKDAQFSYSISLPATPTNNKIFGYTNVEEVKNKFNIDYSATLIVDGIPIFNGRFRMSEISPKDYKGNLVLPAMKTIQDIFGDQKMNEIGDWNIPFKDITESLNKWNYEPDSPCIFPFVLYGLFPKKLGVENVYSPKDVWNRQVKLSIENFAPSINCLKTIETIFKNKVDDKGQRYQITGTAFSDPRLKNLYMSYQNPAEYQQEWNWAHLGQFEISGKWTNFKQNEGIKEFEQFYHRNDVGGKWFNFFAVDLFSCSMLEVTKLIDQGTNVSYNMTDNLRKTMEVLIPQSGLYKIELSASLDLRFTESEHLRDKDTLFISRENIFVKSDKQTIRKNNLTNCRYEVKLVRTPADDDFDIDNCQLDGSLYKENLPQEKEELMTRYFPYPSDKCVQMIDPAQNKHLISGFRWGDYGLTNREHLPTQTEYNPLEEYYGNRIENKAKHCRIMAIKNGQSWDREQVSDKPIYSAIQSDPYHKVEGRSLEEGVVVQETENKFKIEFQDCPANHIENKNNRGGKGKLHQVVWLEKGEKLNLVAISESAHYAKHDEGWMIHDLQFDLKISAFKKNSKWIKVDEKGNGTESMKWSDKTDFTEHHLNLSRFLPSETKVDDWLNNFCKTFNLDLSQQQTGQFRLNTKIMAKAIAEKDTLDIEGKSNIELRTNLPLNLPAEYKLGFKIGQEEEGYRSPDPNNKEVKPEDGSGSIVTGTIDGKILTQNSGFSYTWYKNIIHSVKKGQSITNTTLQIPIISHREVWEKKSGEDDDKMMKNKYPNYTQRLWFRSGKYHNLGTIWKNDQLKVEEYADKKTELSLVLLSNSYEDAPTLHLDYHNKANSILRTYFDPLTTNHSNYTEVECLLTPDEYERMGHDKLVRLNSDLYYVAAIDGYDPTGRNKTKLKLIRKV